MTTNLQGVYDLSVIGRMSTETHNNSNMYYIHGLYSATFTNNYNTVLEFIGIK